jgi:type II secretory pathway pseudopilin PulG
VSTRDRTILVIVGVVAALVGSWMMVIQPKRDQATKLGAQVKAAQSQLNTLRTEVAQRQHARRAFAGEYAKIVRLGEAVPTDDNVPSLIYQLQGAASGARVDFRALQLNPSSGSTPAPSSPSAAQGATATLPPGATVGPAGFPIEPFTFSFQGNFFHLADFFHRLQRFVVATNKRVSISGRLMTLNAINLSAGASGFPQISAQISATTYLVPPSEGLLNGATPAGPSSSATQPVSTPASSSPAPTAVIASPVK